MPRKINESVTASTRARKSSTTSETAPAAQRRHQKATPVAAGSVETTISPNEVAALAYSYWESRGWQHGAAEEDWMRAEAELRSRTATAATA